jgi:hypothetical protein
MITIAAARGPGSAGAIMTMTMTAEAIPVAAVTALAMVAAALVVVAAALVVVAVALVVVVPPLVPRANDRRSWMSHKTLARAQNGPLRRVILLAGSGPGSIARDAFPLWR